MTKQRKSNSVIAVSRSADNHILTFDVLGIGKLPFDRRKASDMCRDYAESHGWEQRIRDEAAIPRDTKTGKSADPQEKYDAMAELVAHYESGTDSWTRAGGGGFGQSVVVAAVARIRGISYSDASASLDRYAAAHFKGERKDAIEFFKTAPAVQKAMLEIQAERMPESKLDADKELAELEAA